MYYVTWIAVPKTVTALNKVVLAIMVWVATGTGVERKHEQVLLTREGAAVPVAPASGEVGWDFFAGWLRSYLAFSVLFTLFEETNNVSQCSDVAKNIESIRP
jgi:hypothetical protein